MVVLAASIVTKNGKGMKFCYGKSELAAIRRCFHASGKFAASLLVATLILLSWPDMSGQETSSHQKMTLWLQIAALVSRQFVEMTRIRIEGLLAAFPKLVGAGKQHTYVETENVRYVYQPMEVRHLPLLVEHLSPLIAAVRTAPKTFALGFA